MNVDARRTAVRFCPMVDVMGRRQEMTSGNVHESTELAADLALARALADLDFSPRSTRLPVIQAEILHRFASGNGRTEVRRNTASRMVSFLGRPLPVAAFSIILCLVLVQCLTPGGIPAAGKAVGSYIVSTLRLGPRTTVKTVDDSQTPAPATLQGTRWRILTSIGSLTGIVRDGASSEVAHYRTVTDARRDAPGFRYLLPAFLPDGMQLSGVQLSPDKEFVVVTYLGQADRDVVFVARANGMQFVTGRGAVEKLTLDGIPAAWVDGRTLIWEKGGVSYAVGGKGLEKETAIRIAESVR
jgi:hypothetical protein